MPVRKGDSGVTVFDTQRRVVVKDIPKVAEFYQRHFGMSPVPSGEKGWLEMTSNSGGCTIAPAPSKRGPEERRGD